MSIQFVSTKSTVFHPNSTTDSQEFVLIYGDEVDTTGEQANGRSKVIYRGREGWIKSDRITEKRPLEMYFIDVGQGDACYIVTPGNFKILIDGGRGNEAFQFLVWRYRLDQSQSAGVDIDLLVLTHADMDHINGLISIIKHKKIRVHKIIHSGIAKFNAQTDIEKLGNVQTIANDQYLTTSHNTIADLNAHVAGGKTLTATMDNWREAVIEEITDTGMSYESVSVASGVIHEENAGAADQLRLHVLGPIPQQVDGHPHAYKWFGTDRETVNGHSVVLRLDFGKVRILLSGDVNEKGAKHLLENSDNVGNPLSVFNAHVLKAPHHGSHDFDLAFLQTVNPQVSIVSSGESPDHGHPRANFLGTIGKVSRSDEPLMFSTELVANFAVDEDAMAPDADDPVDPTNAALLGQARRRFKKRLNGLINVRSDGEKIYCARRVAAGYQFVTYEEDLV